MPGSRLRTIDLSVGRVIHDVNCDQWRVAGHRGHADGRYFAIVEGFRKDERITEEVDDSDLRRRFHKPAGCGQVGSDVGFHSTSPRPGGGFKVERIPHPRLPRPEDLILGG